MNISSIQNCLTNSFRVYHTKHLFNGSSIIIHDFITPINEENMAKEMITIIKRLLYNEKFEMPGIWAAFKNEASFLFDDVNIEFTALNKDFDFDPISIDINKAFQTIRYHYF